MKRRHVRWWEWTVYRVFHYVWSPILRDRPDLLNFYEKHVREYCEQVRKES